MALVPALIVVTAIAVLGAGLVQVQGALMRRHQSAIDARRALYVAEAGISEAWLAVAEGKSGNIATPQVPAAFGDGVYWVEAQEIGDEQISLSAIGLVGRGRYAIDVVVQRPQSPFAQLGIYGDDSVVVEAGAELDDWDSGEGDWVPPEERGDEDTGSLALRSNGDLIFSACSPDPESRTTVWGDVQPGPDGGIEVGPGVMITGATVPSRKPLELPEVEVPPVPLQPDLSVAAGRSAVLTEQALGYGSISVAEGGELRLVGPLEVVVDRLSIASGGSLVIDGSGGPVSLYCVEAVSLPAGSSLTTEGGDAADVALFLLETGDTGQASSKADSGGLGGYTASGTGEPIEFSPGGEFHGILYAPFAHLSIPSDLRVFGSVAASRLELAADAKLTLDHASLCSTIGTDGLPEMVSWRVLPLPDEEIVRFRGDPIKLLDADGIEPVKSSEGAVEAVVHIKYVDINGDYASYSGPEDGLDWGQISRVVGIYWSDGGGGGGAKIGGAGIVAIDD